MIRDVSMPADNAISENRCRNQTLKLPDSVIRDVQLPPLSTSVSQLDNSFVAANVKRAKSATDVEETRQWTSSPSFIGSRPS